MEGFSFKWKKEHVTIAVLVLMAVLGILFAAFFGKEEEKPVPLPPYQTAAADGPAQGAATGEMQAGKEPGEGRRKEAEPAASRTERIQVDVKGEVKFPGVYELPAGARVHEAIERAGGLTPEADTLRVNLAAFLNDGQVLYIPKKGEEAPVWETGESGSRTDGKEQKLNLNTATLEELDSLPGIGPSKAQAILQYREEHGPFTDVKQLEEVSGIGEKTLEKLLPYITVK